ncbi:class I SAM-dependent RNA methyltransferase [Polaromonas sp.]|nr:class I SAM-dependent RNA methyltransferase [Candidatus Saccharibacteria bacterium]
MGRKVSTKPLPAEIVSVTKLVHGGQGLAELSDGRKVFVWNALPGETVRAQVIKQKSSYAEAIAEEVMVASPERVPATEENYLSTSPWQIMKFSAENEHKKSIVLELFGHEKVTLPKVPAVIHDDREWHYRNKMEYSFWGDDDGLHLALHQRGTHGKQIVTGSALAMPAIDAGANAIADQLSAMSARAGDLKTIMVRADAKGNAVAALFVKLESFKKLELPKELKGLRVYHSNPKSPASVPTKLLYELGDTTLRDEVNGNQLAYDPVSFFQANLPVFEKAVKSISKITAKAAKVTDFYSGVGSIGLSLPNTTTLVETDGLATDMAKINIGKRPIEIVRATAETALDYISTDATLIVDPPRAGLHQKVVNQIIDIKPKQIVYLSCNPATQARDLKLLEEHYKITQFEIYNFFPKTPHIETLAVLELI